MSSNQGGGEGNSGRPPWHPQDHRNSPGPGPRGVSGGSRPALTPTWPSPWAKSPGVLPGHFPPGTCGAGFCRSSSQDPGFHGGHPQPQKHPEHSSWVPDPSWDSLTPDPTEGQSASGGRRGATGEEKSGSRDPSHLRASNQTPMRPAPLPA